MRARLSLPVDVVKPLRDLPGLWWVGSRNGAGRVVWLVGLIGREEAIDRFHSALLQISGVAPALDAEEMLRLESGRISATERGDTHVRRSQRWGVVDTAADLASPQRIKLKKDIELPIPLQASWAH
jgi:hypothetical protein